MLFLHIHKFYKSPRKKGTKSVFILLLFDILKHVNQKM